ncbi:MAG: hypothetical protein H6R23_2703, partial [Proteobacteria bacterium]|nr:hypothetical protein [Pseudomonadota bacterium]
EQLREGIVARQPESVLSGEVECDEVDVVALVQYDFRDNCLNIINYLGLFTGSCGASRAGARYKANRLI